MKLVLIYGDKKLGIFYNLNDGKFYYRRAVDTKSAGFIIPYMLLYFLLRQLGEIYQSNFLNNFLNNYCLIIFVLSNILTIFAYILIQKQDYKELHPYYPSRPEFYDNLDKIRNNLRYLIIATAVCAALVLVLAYVYLETGDFTAILGECAFLLFLLFVVHGDGLFYKMRLIQMIENREIP